MSFIFSWKTNFKSRKRRKLIRASEMRFRYCQLWWDQFNRIIMKDSHHFMFHQFNLNKNKMTKAATKSTKCMTSTSDLVMFSFFESEFCVCLSTSLINLIFPSIFITKTSLVIPHIYLYGVFQMNKCICKCERLQSTQTLISLEKHSMNRNLPSSRKKTENNIAVMQNVWK